VLEALDKTSPSVGAPFSVACIREEGAHHLDEKEIAKAQKDVQRWCDLEQEALDKLFD